MTPALRWAAMRAIIFNVSLTVRPAGGGGGDGWGERAVRDISDKVTRQCPLTTTFEERAGRAEGESNRGPSAYQPNALPLGQASSQLASILLLPWVVMPLDDMPFHTRKTLHDVTNFMERSAPALSLNAIGCHSTLGKPYTISQAL